MTVYHSRFSQQVEVADAARILERWEPS